NGYVLLARRDRTDRPLRECEFNAFASYLGLLTPDIHVDRVPRKVHRWARLRLPNGQIARSLWKEQDMRG
ncbi:hypothetical protein BJ138DRAFT_989908, partial [Hygrophoropsis aurantiaca]